MTEKIPQVSVVVIFHNAERFLVSVLESVRDQTFDDWELLLVDDGSTDASAAIARSFQDRFPQLTFILHHPEHQRRGMSASRSLGARAARGNYLAFLDADDVWVPRKLEQQVAMLTDQTRADAEIGRTLYWSSWLDGAFGAASYRAPDRTHWFGGGGALRRYSFMAVHFPG